MPRVTSGSQYHASPKKKANVAKEEDSCIGFKLKEQHEKAVEKTKSYTVECMPDYRRRVMKIVLYVKKEYPEIYAEVVYELTPEQKSDPKYHYHKATHDFHYDQFPTKILQSFMSNQWRDEAKGIKYTYDHLRKYHMPSSSVRNFPRPSCHGAIGI